MNTISEAFNDPIMQSMVFGPLAGVVFGALFAGLTNTPPPQNRTNVSTTKIIFVEKKVYGKQGSSSKKDSDDAGAVLVILAALALAAVWGYARYEPQILFYMTSALLSVLAFACTAAAISLIKGQFSSRDWFGHILPPLFVLGSCMYLLELASDAFSADLIDAAKATNVINFYFNVLNDYGRRLLLAQIIGVMILIAIIVITSIAVIHYLSLMNQRSGGALNGLWSYLVRKTLFFGGFGWQVVCGFLLITAYVALEPTLLTQWMARG